MMQRVLFAVLGLMLVFGAYSGVNAQTTGGGSSLEQAMAQLAMDAGKNYVNPIVSGIGTDLNGGWFHRAPHATILGFDLEFGAVGMMTFFKDEVRTFDSNVDFKFNNTEATTLANVADYSSIPLALQPQAKQAVVTAIAGVTFNVDMNGPTVVGSNMDTVKVKFAARTLSTAYGNVDIPEYVFPTGVTGILGDKKYLPLGAPQLTIGTILGSQFTFRYLPSAKSSKLGKLTYFGWGIQHNPGAWLGGVDELPFELSASFFTQKLKYGEILEAKATAFGLNISKRLGWGFLNLTPYAGYMFESSKITFSYTFNSTGPGGIGTTQTPVSFELESANKSRAVVGLSLKFLIVNINADYNFGKYNSATAGVMIII